MRLYPSARLVRIKSVGKLAAIVLALGFAVAARADARSPLDDPKLGASANELRAVVSAAQRDGLPIELLLDKLREGLAKGVPPDRLVAVERTLAQSLTRARDEALPFGEARDAKLLKAIVDAHHAGVTSDDVALLLKSNGREREVEVLTDLVERGYPPGAAARAIVAVDKRDPTALSHLVARTEDLRALDGATPAEALDAVRRAVSRGLGIERAAEALHQGDISDDNGRGPDRETSGPRGPRSGGVAPPGHNKGGNGNGNGNGNK